MKGDPNVWNCANPPSLACSSTARVACRTWAKSEVLETKLGGDSFTTYGGVTLYRSVAQTLVVCLCFLDAALHKWLCVVFS